VIVARKNFFKTIGIYGLFSILTVAITGVDGVAPNWLLQALLGPLWHLSAFISICRRPFEYLDGVVRLTREDALMGAVSISIWAAGAIILAPAVCCENVKLKRFFQILFFAFWIVVAIINIFFYGLFTV